MNFTKTWIKLDHGFVLMRRNQDSEPGTFCGLASSYIRC
jgi:hypothetical protein